MSLFYIVLIYYFVITVAPEAVTDIIYDVLNSTAIRVHWIEPSIPRGIITQYEVNVTVISSYDNFNVIITKNLSNGSVIELGMYLTIFNAVIK